MKKGVTLWWFFRLVDTLQKRKVVDMIPNIFIEKGRANWNNTQYLQKLYRVYCLG
jgi:hypothetical protein